ncbi:hypothetical protein STRTUCAR8_07970, partial [Streptomyces turgidiscabies Car8]
MTGPLRHLSHRRHNPTCIVGGPSDNGLRGKAQEK